MTIDRHAYTPREAAATFGVGRTFFDVEIRPELRVVRRGRKTLIPATEIDRWLERNAEPVFGKEAA